MLWQWLYSITATALVASTILATCSGVILEPNAKKAWVFVISCTLGFASLVPRLFLAERGNEPGDEAKALPRFDQLASAMSYVST